jgi:hypothetical protein
MRQLMIAALLCGLTSTVFSQGVAISESPAAPDNSAILDLQSTSKGTLITRMTSAERDNIASPAEGLLIFNTGDRCFEFYAYGAWHQMACAPCPMPGTSSEGSLVPGATSINWNWTCSLRCNGIPVWFRE